MKEIAHTDAHGTALDLQRYGAKQICVAAAAAAATAAAAAAAVL